MSETVLITGGAGFIGSHLADALIEKNYRVILFDNIDPQIHPGGEVPGYLPREAELIVADMADRERLAGAVTGADYICHLAAAVGVGQAQYQISHYVRTNIGGTANLLDCAVKFHGEGKLIKKIVLAGSMSEYGEGEYDCTDCGRVYPRARRDEDLRCGRWEYQCPTCESSLRPAATAESAPLLGTSTYGISKRVQEELITSVCTTYRIPHTVLRLFNTYGIRQSLSNPYTGVAAIFLSRLKNSRSPVVFEDGGQLRDFVSVHDVVAAFIAAIESKAADNRVFNVGSGESITVRDLAKIIARIAGKEISPEILNRYRSGDIRHCYADITAIRKALGFEPRVRLEDGLNDLARWSEGAEAIDRFDGALEELRRRDLA